MHTPRARDDIDEIQERTETRNKSNDRWRRREERRKLMAVMPSPVGDEENLGG
jgi:hypothetical protein